MKAGAIIVSGLWIILHFAAALPAVSEPEISCGETITENTTLDADLACPEGTEYTIVIGASNITLDLGGHTLSGHAPGTGVLSAGYDHITIRNGTIEGFNDGVFLIDTQTATVENLTIRNLDINDPSHFIFGVHIDSSQGIVVREMQFEFLIVAHKEAVEIFYSTVDVSNIEVRGGGAGVSFSFAGGVCDPVNAPSNGSVINSRFSDVYGAGIWIACSSSALIENNDFSTPPGTGVGIMGDAPFSGAVTGLIVRNNTIHDAMIGIEFRGIRDSNISNNHIFDNQIWGIAIRQSLGCLTPEPGWECFTSTANVIADNQTWDNAMDLYHYEDSLGNTWQGNTCEIKDGAEIPACTPPAAALTINYASGKPGSFFTLEGDNFPPDDTASITINGALLGTVPTDAAGDLLFLLNTTQADTGGYTVTAAVNPVASVGLVLDSSKPTRLQEGQGTIFVVPGSLVTDTLSLPLLVR
jgi:hypothetical protein